MESARISIQVGCTIRLEQLLKAYPSTPKETLIKRVCECRPDEGPDEGLSSTLCIAVKDITAKTGYELLRYFVEYNNGFVVHFEKDN